MNLWSLEGGYNSYLATSPTGTATGFGATLLIIDDLIKNAEEASNENVLEKHWEWFTNTMLSRLEEGGKIIIIMTRWASGDLAGRALEHFRSEKKRVRHLTMKALQDDGTMLCPDVLSRESYDMKVRAMGEDIASANYQQIPIDIKGKLYSSFKTYTQLPEDVQGESLFTGIYAYCDSADDGADYLCNVIWGHTRKRRMFWMSYIPNNQWKLPSRLQRRLFLRSRQIRHESSLTTAVKPSPAISGGFWRQS